MVSLLFIVAVSCLILATAYFTYGRFLGRLFHLDKDAQTPAVELRDDVDFVPIDSKFLLGQHFSAIAAAGPIVGPILAGVMFGWGPALAWILIGSVFVGGVHDFGALVASVRHKARSVAEVLREYMTRRAYVLFLTFIWLTLIYIILAFTDIVAASFVGKQTLENGLTVSGGGIATSSLLYLALPVMMSLVMRYARMPLWFATIIFIPLVGMAIWCGQYIPFDLARILGLSDNQARLVWDVLLLVYCFVASVIPMWLLLQTRGYLGGFFLYIAMAGGILGLMFSGKTIQYPAYLGLVTAKGEPIFPLLFITVACGACSGFHALVASGTTSKQLKKETDAKLIGYGAMLLEGLVAVVSLACVMMLAKNAAVLKGTVKPNLIYGIGIGSFLEVIHIPPAIGISFGLLAFTTFVYDTLDVSTRLGRYILQELSGMSSRMGGYLATAITAFVPLLFLMQENKDAAGNIIPAWKVFWSLFGASNQLLAALTLVAVTVWISRTYKARWTWLVTGGPTIWMFVMSVWTLLRFVKTGFFTPTGDFRSIPTDAVTWVALLLIILAVLIFLEAGKALSKSYAAAVPLAKAHEIKEEHDVVKPIF
jgi:carbon starvation protein